MSDTPRTDAADKKYRAYDGYHNLAGFADFTRQLERELIAACDDLESARTLIRSFDAAIRRIAHELTGQACCGVDTDNEINPETGVPYGPGGHTGWLLAKEAAHLQDKLFQATKDNQHSDDGWNKAFEIAAKYAPPEKVEIALEDVNYAYRLRRIT